MKEKDKIHFYDTSMLVETEGFCARANALDLEAELKSRFPGEAIHVRSVKINKTGKHRQLFLPIKGLPPYCSVKVEHGTGMHTEKITVWLPLAWNDRFVGVTGGGTSTGGDTFLLPPDNTSRGLTLPFAVMNGFAAATTDAGNPTQEWALDKTTGKRDSERIESWRARSTHFMTLTGKAVAEILHGRSILFSYLHGGSGGGRQALVEAQEFPEDYDGIWASCPAINWTKFLLCGLWHFAVMNNHKNLLPCRKLDFFLEAVHNSVGGKAAYYRRSDRIEFDPFTLIGQRVNNGRITKDDAAVMREIWNGPHRKNGEPLWVGFRPGVQFWTRILPVTALYYNLFGKPKMFGIVTHYLRWITENPKQKFLDVTMDTFEAYFDQSTTLFASATADRADLSEFAKHGRLIIDHGVDDPLIPVDGSIRYYENVCRVLGGQDTVARFLRMYITPGDGHGNCRWHGPGITESEGISALIKWVENGIAPHDIQTVKTDRKGNAVIRSSVQPYKIREPKDN